MKKKTSLSAKLIAAFMAAILGSVLICALLTHSKVESVLNSNMQLTSEQTLNSAMTSLQTYEKTISIPVDLLTRKDSIKRYCSLASLTLAVKLCAKDYIMPDYSPMHRRCI